MKAIIKILLCGLGFLAGFFVTVMICGAFWTAFGLPTVEQAKVIGLFGGAAGGYYALRGL